MHRTMQRLAGFLKRMTALVALIPVVLTGILCIRIQIFVTMDLEETVLVRRNPVWIPVAALALFLAILLMRDLLRRIPETAIFAAGAGLWLAAGLVLIRCAGYQIRMDQEYVYEYALAFMRGDYGGLDPDRYLGWYPYQLGLLTWERLFLTLNPSTRILFLVNLALVLLIQFFQWRIARLLFDGRPEVVKLALILSFLFLPQLFYVLFLYGQIPGLCFTEGGILCLLHGRSDAGHRLSRVLCLLSAVVFLTVAVLLKPNYAIAAVAVGLICIMEYLQTERRRFPVFIITLALAVPASTQLLYHAYEAESRQAVCAGIPMVSNFVMGLQETEEKPYNDGWNNEYDLDVYAGNGSDPEAAKRQSILDLRARGAELTADPRYAGEFFFHKLLSTWCDPMFQSVWSGPRASLEQDIDTRFLREFFEGEGVYPLLADSMNVLMILLYLGAGWYLVRVLAGRSRPEAMLLLPAMYYFGGVLYHLLSETKSQYVYMYVYTLIPLSAAGISALADRLRVLPAKKRR